MALVEPFLGHPVEVGVFAQGGEQAPLLPLDLDPQGVDDVAAGEDLVEVVGDLAAEPLEPPGDERRRAAEDHLGPELEQAPDVRPGHPGMADVADQADGQALDRPLGPADGQEVEQPLRRVLVGAVAGVDDRGLDVLREQVGGARAWGGGRPGRRRPSPRCSWRCR